MKLSELTDRAEHGDEEALFLLKAFAHVKFPLGLAAIEAFRTCEMNHHAQCTCGADSLYLYAQGCEEVPEG